MKTLAVRVYGLLVQDDHLLVSHETYGQRPAMIKFPGGGLEFGEGPEACLAREWREELDADIEVGPLLCVPREPVISAFNPDQQVVCLYYRVLRSGPLPLRPGDAPFEKRLPHENLRLRFWWQPIAALEPALFTWRSEQAAAAAFLDAHAHLPPLPTP